MADDGKAAPEGKPADDAAARAAAAAADDDAPLGEKGEKALKEWKQRARDAETWRKENEPHVAKAREADEAAKTETQKAAERAAAAEKDAAEAKGMALRYEVAADVGLPLKMARRLHGSTKEELEEDARDLLESLGGKVGEQQRPRSNGNAGDEGTAPGGTMSDVLRGGLKSGRMSITT